MYNSKSKNRIGLLGSRAQERMLSGVERHQESREERDCLRLSERRKKNSRKKFKQKFVLGSVA